MLVPDRDNLRPPIPVCGNRSTNRASGVARAGEGRSWLLAGSGGVNSAGCLRTPLQREMPVSRHEPMFNVQASVLAVLGLMVAVHLVRMGLSQDWDTWVTLALAFIPARYSGFAELLPGGQIASATSFLTHTLLHGDFVHLGLNAAWLVAFGGAVANRVGSVRFLLFFAFCAIAGAATFLAFNPRQMVPMVGASGAISGLMGGTMRFLFTAVDGRGLAALREDPRSAPLMPLAQALTDKRVVLVTVVFLI